MGGAGARLAYLPHPGLLRGIFCEIARLKKRVRGELRYSLAMIQRLSHTTLYVTDQNAARDFYVNKLGFGLRMDQEANGFRWLTVGPKGQPDFQLILMKIGANCGNDDKASAQIRDLVTSGRLGAAGVFETADCRKTYEELSAKGVEFLAPPEENSMGSRRYSKTPAATGST
jgi:catechol 2,3-dioxygenase-like lactoylglutathione lyase family enzyme